GDHSELHFRNLLRHDQLAGGPGDDFLDADTRRALAQDEGAVLDLQVGQVGKHLADAAGAGERQAAAFQQLGLAVLGGVGHDHDDVLGARHQVHGSAHALDQLAGDHPGGDVALHVHLEGAKYREVHMAATDHGEGFRRVEDHRVSTCCTTTPACV